MLAGAGIDKADQILGAELMVDVGDLDLADRDRLRIIGDRARHLEQRADGHVFPCRILRQPFSDRVVELELARRFELEDQRGGEFLGVAANLEQSIGADRLRVGKPIVAGEDRDDRVAGAAVHPQRGAREPFDRPACLDIGVDDPLQLGRQRRVIGLRRRRENKNGAEERENEDSLGQPHVSHSRSRATRRAAAEVPSICGCGPVQPGCLTMRI